ncbi:MAG TPA: apolipoprotein N-acyltransferase, partial [Actinomycetota bacterium]|nr:apolipoprotein N-acyltransferase [Actinomycetota bacterium]
MRGRRRLMALGLSLSSSALLALSSEPFAFAPVAWVALTPLFVAILREPKWRWSALYGFVCGAAYFAFHLSWIFLFGWMAWVGLVLVMSAFSAAAGWAAGVVRRLPLAPALVAGAWTGAELLRDRIPWGGFSWGTLGTSQAAMPGVRWLAGTVGAFGLTFLTAFVAAVVADRVVAGGMPWGSIGLVGAVLVALVAVDAAMFAGAGQGRPFEVAVVQGNVPRPYDELRQRERVFEGHMRLTRTLLDDPARPDLVVWAEDAVRSDVLPDADAQIAALAAELGTPMLVGRSETDFVREGFLNLVDHIDEAGTTVDSYSKRHPVPFGEYVPVSFLRRFVTTLDQVPYDMLRGSEPTVFDVSGTKVAAPICFESVFPRDVRVFARKG